MDQTAAGAAALDGDFAAADRTRGDHELVLTRDEFIGVEAARLHQAARAVAVIAGRMMVVRRIDFRAHHLRDDQHVASRDRRVDRRV